MKSVLKKGPKVAIKTYKHELVVTIRARVTYKREKNQVRKRFNAGLSDALKLIRDTLLEGKSDVAFLGKEGRKSTKPAIRTLADFPGIAYAFKRDYAFIPSPFAFMDARKGTTKTVELCMVLGMDEEIGPRRGTWTSRKKE